MVASSVFAVILRSARPPGPGDELVGRAGRVVRLCRVVEQRLVGILDQLLVVGGADPAGEQVVVVGRQADEGEDLAGLRVHHDDDATLEADLPHRPLERGFGVLLLLGVDREVERVARAGLADRLENLGPAARRIALDALRAVDAPQLGLVLRLEPGLAEEIVGQVAASAAGRAAARPRPDPCSRGSATAAGRTVYWRRASTAISTPGKSNPASEISSAVCSSTSPAIRTRSKFEPGFESIAALISRDAHVEQRREPLDDLRAKLLREVGRSNLDRKCRARS